MSTPIKLKQAAVTGVDSMEVVLEDKIPSEYLPETPSGSGANKIKYNEGLALYKDNSEIEGQTEKVKFKSINNETLVGEGNINIDISGKQDKLIAGTNINIAEDGKTISATGGTSYSAGNGISINNATISIKAADRSIHAGEFGVRTVVDTTSLTIGDTGVSVKIANDSILATDDKQGTKGIKVNTEKIQSKLTTGDNISIIDNKIAVEVKSVTLSGTSGTLTEEQVTLLNSVLTYIVLNNKRFYLSKVVQGSRDIAATYTCVIENSSDYIIVSLLGKSWEYHSTPLALPIQSIDLSGTIADGEWHDGGTLSAEQGQILTSSEVNYIWLNNMHRLDFRYRDNYNDLATYSSNDGEKCHLVEIVLSTKAWRYKHVALQTQISFPTTDGDYKLHVENGIISWVQI